MADTDAEWCLGDEMEYGDGGSPTETFTEIAGIKNIDFNLGSRALVDTTTHQSTRPYQDNVATFLQGGTITLTGNNLPENASQIAVQGKLADDLPTTFRYTMNMSSGKQIHFTGKARVTAFNPNSNADDARRLTISLAPTGAWPRTQES